MPSLPDHLRLCERKLHLSVERDALSGRQPRDCMALFKRGFGRRDLLIHWCLGMSRHQIEPDADRAERRLAAVGQGQPVFERGESGAANDLVGLDEQSEGVPQRRRTGGRSAADNRALDFGDVPAPAASNDDPEALRAQITSLQERTQQLAALGDHATSSRDARALAQLLDGILRYAPAARPTSAQASDWLEQLAPPGG